MVPLLECFPLVSPFLVGMLIIPLTCRLHQFRQNSLPRTNILDKVSVMHHIRTEFPSNNDPIF